MYLYFDNNGVLKEIINDKALRQGNYEYNDIYIYWPDIEKEALSSIRFRYVTEVKRYPQILLSPLELTNISELPFNSRRDLKFFKYGKPYKMYKIPTSFAYEGTEKSVLDDAGVVALSIYVTNSSDITRTLGKIVFNVEQSTEGDMEIQADEYITLAQWNYLINKLSKVTDDEFYVYEFKGSVDTYAGLPENASNGDVYNVLNTGKNYAWNGTDWSEVAGIVDTSKFVTLSDEQTITGEKTFTDRIVLESQDAYMNLTDGLAYISGTYEIELSDYGWIELEYDTDAGVGNYACEFYDIEHEFNHEYKITNKNADGIEAESEITLDSEGVKIVAPEIKLNGVDTSKLATLNSGIIGDNQVFTGYNRFTHEVYFELGVIVDYIHPFNMSENKITLDAAKVSPQGANQTLGDSSKLWKDIYLSGNVTDGTNSVTVANIAQKGTTQIASGTFSDGELTISASLLTDGMYMFTYGNAQAFVFINSTLLDLSSTYPIRVAIPVIWNAGEGADTGNLKIQKSGTDVIISVKSLLHTVLDGYELHIYKTKLQ